MFVLGPLLNHNVAAMAGGGGAVATTFDPVNSITLADLTFSNGNLTVLRSGTSAFHSEIRGTTSKTSGGWKATIDNYTGSGNIGAGFGNGSETGQLGNSTNSVGYLQDGSVWYNGFTGLTGPTYTTGAFIEPHFDGTHVTWKKNGTDIGVSIDVSSTLSSVMPLFWTAPSAGHQVTGDFANWV